MSEAGGTRDVSTVGATAHARGTLRGAPFLARLTPEQCERLHGAAVAVLERTGLLVQEPEALGLLASAGARVDGSLVHIPERLIEWAFGCTPRSVTLYDRHGAPAIEVGGYRAYFGPGSDCLYCLDHRTGERRRAVLQDVVEAARVSDACENVDFAMSFFTPSDVTAEVADRHQMEAMLCNTTKPIVYVTLNDPLAHSDVIAMAETVAGGAAALEAAPTIACYKNTLFPLVHNAEAVRTLLDLSRRGLPCIYSPVSTAGTVAPMTVAGSAVVVAAGVLAGLVMSQLAREGAPFIAIGWAGEAMDMRTMVDAYAWPDHRGILATLMHHYDLPMFTLGGVSDAKLDDQQAAAEAALTLMVDALAGGQLIHDLGYLESAYSGSLTQLVLCDEIVGWIRSLMQPVDIGDESLALDAIDRVGPGGVFLGDTHTRDHVRGRYRARLFERDTYQGWLAAGGHDATARASRRVDEILAEHEPEPLPDDVRGELRRIVLEAERRVAR
jgi:trimethylamine--corrinoid protein Co-methyltransferase